MSLRQVSDVRVVFQSHDPDAIVTSFCGKCYKLRRHQKTPQISPLGGGDRHLYPGAGPLNARGRCPTCSKPQRDILASDGHSVSPGSLPDARA